MISKKYARHYEESVVVGAEPQSVFAYADNPLNFSSHMNKSSWMMGGGSMKTETDENKGQKVGSHIRMSGAVFGVGISLDEVVTIHNAPHRKEWETVGDVNLLVIDQYRLGFEITPQEQNSNLMVYIDYDLPKSGKTELFGKLFGELYAKWCVRQMASGTKIYFDNPHQK